MVPFGFCWFLRGCGDGEGHLVDLAKGGFCWGYFIGWKKKKTDLLGILHGIQLHIKRESSLFITSVLMKIKYLSVCRPM